MINEKQITRNLNEDNKGKKNSKERETRNEVRMISFFSRDQWVKMLNEKRADNNQDLNLHT